MGAESDHLIFDYLSRVGDLAQTELTADRRVRLVTELRKDIDRQRGAGDSPAAVRRILGRLGSPDAVVEAAAGVPPQRDEPPRGDERRRGDEPARRDGPALGDAPARRDGPARPSGLPGTTGGLTIPLGPAGPDDRPMRPGEELSGLPGMTGGLTIPLEPPPAAGKDAAEAEETAGTDRAGGTGTSRSARRRRLLRRRRPADVTVAAVTARRRPALLPTLAALLLVAGAVLGSWLPLGLGWLLAYYVPGLSRRQAKFAALTLPGLVAAGTLVWLWGRTDGRWGEPIAKGQLDTAIVDAFPVVVRVAAGASAAFLLWRGSVRR